MDIVSFIDEFRKIAQKFFWTRWPEIRGIPLEYTSWKKSFCPITALVFDRTLKRFSLSDVYHASAVLNMSIETTRGIVLAIDRQNGYDLDVRRSLEECCFSEKKNELPQENTG